MKNVTKTMSWKLLEWIGSNPNGVTLTEIQFYIWTVLEGKPELEFFETNDHTWQCSTDPSYSYTDPNCNARKTRGHWNTALYGGYYYHKGLLHLYCEKINKKWKLVKMPEPNGVIYQKYTKSDRVFHY